MESKGVAAGDAGFDIALAQDLEVAAAVVPEDLDDSYLKACPEGSWL